MKIIFSVFLIVLIVESIITKNKLYDINCIVLNTYLPIHTEPIPDQAESLLENKLSQIASYKGMGGSSVNPRFVLMANTEADYKAKWETQIQKHKDAAKLKDEALKFEVKLMQRGLGEAILVVGEK
jgi:hypothetical protein